MELFLGVPNMAAVRHSGCLDRHHQGPVGMRLVSALLDPGSDRADSRRSGLEKSCEIPRAHQKPAAFSTTDVECPWSGDAYRFIYDMMPITLSEMSIEKRVNLFKAGSNLVYRRLSPGEYATPYSDRAHKLLQPALPGPAPPGSGRSIVEPRPSMSTFFSNSSMKWGRIF